MGTRRAVSASVWRSLRAVGCGLRAILPATTAIATSIGHAYPCAAQASEPRPELSAYLVVLAGGLNIREVPDLGARVVGVAGRGDRLCVIRYEGSWAEVVAPATSIEPRRRGFVARGFVSEIRAGRAEMEAMGCPLPPPGGGRDPPTSIRRAAPHPVAEMAGDNRRFQCILKLPPRDPKTTSSEGARPSRGQARADPVGHRRRP